MSTSERALAAEGRRSRKPLTIAVLSFNRPDYLRMVLHSLFRQVIPGDQVFLFQDGAWNPSSRTMRAQEDVIDLCVRNFTSPRATTASVDRRVFRSPVHLGIAGNYRRAENYIFEVLACQSALLLEDDLVLGPHYLTAVAGLLDIAAEETRIGYVSAYGDLWATLERQRAGVDRLMPMHENWGAALTRTSWLAQKPIREQYWEFVKDIDYSQRDNAAIRAFYASLGYRCEITSQDASRWIACRAAGLVRIMTKTCHARYVGVIGEHSTRDFYERWKFGESTTFPEPPVVRKPGKRDIDRWLRADAAAFADGYVHAYQKPSPRASRSRRPPRRND